MLLHITSKPSNSSPLDSYKKNAQGYCNVNNYKSQRHTKYRHLDLHGRGCCICWDHPCSRLQMDIVWLTMLPKRVWYANIPLNSSRCSTPVSTTMSLFMKQVQNMVRTVQLHCHSATRTIIQESTQLHTPIDVGQAAIVNAMWLRIGIMKNIDHDCT